MAKFDVGNGISEYVSKLIDLDKSKMCGRIVYPGARCVVDAIDSSIDTIPSDVASDIQRSALHQHLGISKMKNSGGVYFVKAGFDGYYEDGHVGNSERWTAVPFLANRIRFGTSNTRGFDFVGQAISKSKKQAEETMKNEADKIIGEIFKE